MVDSKPATAMPSLVSGGQPANPSTRRTPGSLTTSAPSGSTIPAPTGWTPKDGVTLSQEKPGRPQRVLTARPFERLLQP
jgi:hypothetical protein